LRESDELQTALPPFSAGVRHGSLNHPVQVVHYKEKSSLHPNPVGPTVSRLPLNLAVRHPPACRLAGLVLAFLAAGPAQAQDLNQAARQLRAGYAAAMEQLAAWCDRQGLAAEAKKTRAWLAPKDPYKLYLAVVPSRVGPPPLPENASPEAAEWNTRWQRLRRDQAAALYDLARRAAKAQRASLAYEMALAAVRENPDHEGLRRLMGQQKLKDQWCTAYEIRKLRSGQVWHERFGWLPAAHVARYEQGQRYSGGKWISAAQDARLHRQIDSGWQVETEHYTVVTDHSLEAGVRLGTKLEKLYRIWQQLFVRYYASQAQVLAMFDGRRAPPIELPRHQVIYYRDREEYNEALRSVFADIEKTIGAYLQQTRRAYFFAPKGKEPQDERTLYHEATHQLFHESRPVAPDVGQRCNFWIVEGIAMFMESLHEEDDFHVLGGVDDVRMQAARFRLLEDRFYVPFRDLTAYGMYRLQLDKQIATLYSQAAGQTHFLIFYEGGRYRDALVAYLTAVYEGRDEPRTLSRLVGLPYEELDRQYRGFLEETAKRESARASTTRRSVSKGCGH